MLASEKPKKPKVRVTAKQMRAWLIRMRFACVLLGFAAPYVIFAAFGSLGEYDLRYFNPGHWHAAFRYMWPIFGTILTAVLWSGADLIRKEEFEVEGEL